MTSLSDDGSGGSAFAQWASSKQATPSASLAVAELEAEQAAAVAEAKVSPFLDMEPQLTVPAASQPPVLSNLEQAVSDELAASQGTSKGNKIASRMDAVGSVPASSDASASGAATGQVPVPVVRPVLYKKMPAPLKAKMPPPLFTPEEQEHYLKSELAALEERKRQAQQVEQSPGSIYSFGGKNTDQSELPVDSGNTETPPGLPLLRIGEVGSGSSSDFPIVNIGQVPPPPPPMPEGGVAAIEAIQQRSCPDAPSVSAANAAPWDNVSSFSQDDDSPASFVTGRQWPDRRERRLVRDDFGKAMWLPPTSVGEPSGFKVFVSDIPGDWELNKAADS